MGHRSGYEYSFDFSMDDKIIPLYPFQVSEIREKKGGFLFEIQTNFKLKTRVHDEKIMGSERFAEYIFKDEDLEISDSVVSFRLQDDYWMSADEFDTLFRAAMDFARQREAEHPQRTVIPVVVQIDVWTVQQEGESVNHALDRAIMPDRLIPIAMWPVIPTKLDDPWKMIQLDEGLPPYLDRKEYLWALPRIRVEDEVGLGLMDTCPVCWRSPIIGDQVSFLPDCNHPCHSHCFFKWLKQGRDTCPSCDLYIPRWLDRNLESQERLSKHGGNR